MDYEILVAGADKDREVWAAANQYPMAPQANRLIVVRDAEKVKNWTPLEPWLNSTRTLPTVYLVFISNDDHYYVRGQDGKLTSDLKAHLPPFRDKSAGALIRCVSPSADIPRDPKTKRPMREVSDLQAYVQSLLPMRADVASHVIDRLAGDLGQIKNLCAKAAVFKGEPTVAIVDALCEPAPGDEFVLDLIRLDKKSAFLALDKLSPSEYLMTLGNASYWLDVTSRVADGLRQRKTSADMAQMPGLGRFQVQTVLQAAKAYDKHRVSHCRSVLAMADEAVRQGVTDSPMQVLTALW